MSQPEPPAPPRRRPDPAAQLLEAVSLRQPDQALALSLQWVHRRGIADLRRFCDRDLRTKLGEDAVTWLLELLESGTAAQPAEGGATQPLLQPAAAIHSETNSIQAIARPAAAAALEPTAAASEAAEQAAPAPGPEPEEGPLAPPPIPLPAGGAGTQIPWPPSLGAAAEQPAAELAPSGTAQTGDLTDGPSGGAGTDHGAGDTVPAASGSATGVPGGERNAGPAPGFSQDLTLSLHIRAEAAVDAAFAALAETFAEVSAATPPGVSPATPPAIAAAEPFVPLIPPPAPVPPGASVWPSASHSALAVASALQRGAAGQAQGAPAATSGLETPQAGGGGVAPEAGGGDPNATDERSEQADGQTLSDGMSGPGVLLGRLRQGLKRPRLPRLTRLRAVMRDCIDETMALLRGEDDLDDDSEEAFPLAGEPRAAMPAWETPEPAFGSARLHASPLPPAAPATDPSLDGPIPPAAVQAPTAVQAPAANRPGSLEPAAPATPLPATTGPATPLPATARPATPLPATARPATADATGTPAAVSANPTAHPPAATVVGRAADRAARLRRGLLERRGGKAVDGPAPAPSSLSDLRGWLPQREDLPRAS